MLKSLASWLSRTSISQVIQDVFWIIPTVQIFHILAIAIVMSSVLMIDVRLFGLAGTRTTVFDTARRYVPWIWGALAVLVVSGTLLVVGEPGRSLPNPVFQLKMAMLLCAATATAIFQVTVHRNAALWDHAPARNPAAKLFALLTLLLWLAIVVAGRWIAYTAEPDFN